MRAEHIDCTIRAPWAARIAQLRHEYLLVTQERPRACLLDAQATASSPREVPSTALLPRPRNHAKFFGLFGLPTNRFGLRCVWCQPPDKLRDGWRPLVLRISSGWFRGRPFCLIAHRHPGSAAILSRFHTGTSMSTVPNNSIQRMQASRWRQLQFGRPWRLAPTADAGR